MKRLPEITKHEAMLYEGDSPARIHAPLTSREAAAPYRDETYGYITVEISIALSTLTDDFERVLDEISMAVTGDDVLSDISYEVVGVEQDNRIILRVTGDPTYSYEE